MQAKGIILTAILAIIGAITKDIWYYKLFSKSDIKKSEIVQADSLVNVDKKAVVDKTTKEIFTNYYETINSLQKNYAPISAMGYIDEYLKKEIPNIETRILNKSYIHRFSSNESRWTEDDFSEVATLIEARTITRIKEISEDVESKARGAFTITEDKLRLLKEQVRIEVGETQEVILY